jgi:hypothetical protein
MDKVTPMMLSNPRVTLTFSKSTIGFGMVASNIDMVVDFKWIA